MRWPYNALMKILLKVQYIGTAYCGFQCQKNGSSIQEVLTQAAERVFGRPCSVTGCSRTDAGVHALGYVCAVSPAIGETVDWCRIPVPKIHRAFAPFLPPDISVCAAAEAEDTFHPRYDAVEKEYVYRIWDAPYATPFLKDRSYHSIRRITPEGLDCMQTAAAAYIGKQDFRAFMAGGTADKDTVRTVMRAWVERQTDGMIQFSVAADGFLYNMVRIMTGTLLDVAAGRILPQDISEILSCGDRSRAGFTAPPDGLYLRQVWYPSKISWQCE